MGKIRPTELLPTDMRIVRRLSGWRMFWCPCGYRRTVPRWIDAIEEMYRHRCANTDLLGWPRNSGEFRRAVLADPTRTPPD